MTGSTAQNSPPSQQRPGRARGRLVAGLGSAVAVTAGLALVFALLPSDSDSDSDRAEDDNSSLSLTHSDGLVVTTGDGYPASSVVEVRAQFDGGSGSAVLAADSGGDFVVAFRPPAGFSGDVHVSADASGTGSSSVIAVPPAGSAGDGDPTPGTPGSDALMVVPTTGAPAVTEIVPSDSGLPRFGVPAEITDDCSRDVTEQLNDWLDTVPDGSQVDFSGAGCYRVEGSLRLSDRNDLVIAGNGATFSAGQQMPSGTRNRAQWWLQYGRNITLRDMTLIGVNPEAKFDLANEWDHNLFIRGTDTVTIDNVHGRKAFGDFIAIAQGPDETTIPRNITIRNVSADIVGRMGISCVACDGVSVDNSVFNNIAYHVFDLEIQGDDWPGRNVRYTNNTIGQHGWAFFSVGTPYQTYDNDLSDVHIAGNTMTDPGEIGDKCLPAISFVSSKIRASGVTIEDNTLLSHTDAVMVKLASSVTIRNNTARLIGPSCGEPVGVRTAQVDGADVAGNDLIGYQTSHAGE